MDELELNAQLEKHHADSYGWALYCCSYNKADAEDVLQNAYMKVLQGKACYKRRSSFKTWLFSVIRYTAASEMRFRWIHRLCFEKYGNDVLKESLCPEIWEELDREELSRRIRMSFEGLSVQQKEVFHLVFYQRMTLNEVALVMCISLGTARKYYERGKQNMRKMLTEQEDGHEAR